MSSFSSVLARAVIVLEGDDTKLQSVMSAAEKRLANFGKHMTEVGQKMTTAVTLPLVGAGFLAVRSFGEQEDALAKVAAVIKATGGAAGITAEHVAELGTQLQRQTTYADEVTESGAAVLLTFKTIRNEQGKGNAVFDRAVSAMQDMAQLMDGDMRSAAVQLGRALESPQIGLSMLQRIGVSFSEAEKDQIKTLFEHGKVLEAQKLVLAGIEKQVGGLSKAVAATPWGRFKVELNLVGDAMETVGAIIIQAILPIITKIEQWATAFTELSPTVQKIIVGVAAFVAIIGPALVAIGMLVTAIATIGGVGTLVIAAFAAVVVAGYEVVKHWTWVKLQAVSFWAFLKDLFFRGVDSLLASYQNLISGIGKAVGMLGRLPGPLKHLGVLAKPFEMVSDAVQHLRDGLGVMADESMAKSGRAMSQLEQQLNATGDAAEETAKKVKTVTPPPPAPAPPPEWLKPATDALKALDAALDQAKVKQQLFGQSFDYSAAQSEALETAVNALVAAGVPLNTTLDSTGRTLGSLAHQLTDVRNESEVTQAVTDALNASYDRAKQAVEATITPQEQYGQVMRDLQAALDAGKISQEEFERAAQHAQNVLDESTKKTGQFSEAIQNMTGRALDEFVDFAFGAKVSFRDFIKQAIMDLTKLILKIELMKILFPKDGGGLAKFLPGFATGGFLRPGEFGIVGERGPELVYGGRSGVQVTPMGAVGAVGAAVGGGGDAVHVSVSVSAIDSRDVARFFDENESLVAGSMLKAWQRSALLRNRMGR